METKVTNVETTTTTAAPFSCEYTPGEVVPDINVPEGCLCYYCRNLLCSARYDHHTTTAASTGISGQTLSMQNNGPKWETPALTYTGTVVGCRNDDKSAAETPFAAIMRGLITLQARKNRTYGDSFGKSVSKYGPVSALTRMSDKWNRVEHLMLGGRNEVSDESLYDTLCDLAVYAVMTVAALADDEARAKLLKALRDE